jgi:hypothetical protein
MNTKDTPPNLGCAARRLKLAQWQRLAAEVDSVSQQAQHQSRTSIASSLLSDPGIKSLAKSTRARAASSLACCMLSSSRPFSSRSSSGPSRVSKKYCGIKAQR